jgi:hypothetical protein
MILWPGLSHYHRGLTTWTLVELPRTTTTGRNLMLGVEIPARAVFFAAWHKRRVAEKIGPEQVDFLLRLLTHGAEPSSITASFFVSA